MEQVSVELAGTLRLRIKRKELCGITVIPLMPSKDTARKVSWRENVLGVGNDVNMSNHKSEKKNRFFIT